MYLFTPFRRGITACLLLTMSLLFANSVYANVFTGKKIAPPENVREGLRTEFKDFTLIELNAHAIYDYVSIQPGHVDFELAIEDFRTWNIGINLNELRHSDFQSNYPEGRATTYKGYLNNNENWQVRMSLFEDILIAMFVEEGQRTYLQPLSDFMKDAPAHWFVFYESENLIYEGDFICGTDHGSFHKEIEKIEKEIDGQTEMSFDGGCIQLGIHADFEFGEVHENDTDIYIDLIVNLAEGVFESTFDIKLNIVSKKIWYKPFEPVCYSYEDPYYSANRTTIKEHIRDWFSSNGIPGGQDIAVLFTGKDLYRVESDGSLNYGVIGTSWSKTVCKNAEDAVAVSENFSTSGKAWKILAHEIGHVIGTGHTADGIMQTPYSGEDYFDFPSISNIDIFLDAHGEDCLNCVSGPGDPCGSCGCLKTDPVSLQILSDLSQLIQNELHDNYIIGQTAYINHQRQITDILESDEESHKDIQALFKNITDKGFEKLAKYYVLNQAMTVSELDYQMLNRFLSELKVLVKSDDLKSEIEYAQKYLPVIIGKDIEQAFIDFDRAGDLDISQPVVNEVWDENTTQAKLINTIGTYTTLELCSPISEGQVSVWLFDSNGKKLNSIAENMPITDGYFQSEIDKNDLSSGTYFIRIQYLTQENHFHKTLKLPVVR